MDSYVLDGVAWMVCVAATLFLTGLIWFVQVIHYPLFAWIGPHHDVWRPYHAAHCRLTASVVGVPMVTELVSSAWLAYSRPEMLGWVGAIVGFALALATWGITGFLAVPAHNRLAGGFDVATHRRLLRADLARALAWTGHSAILLASIYRSVPHS